MIDVADLGANPPSTATKLLAPPSTDPDTRPAEAIRSEAAWRTILSSIFLEATPSCGIVYTPSLWTSQPPIVIQNIVLRQRVRIAEQRPRV